MLSLSPFPGRICVYPSFPWVWFPGQSPRWFCVQSPLSPRCVDVNQMLQVDILFPQGVVKVGAVDADKHQSLGGQYGVQGFPTIKIFGSNKNRPEDFQGKGLAASVLWLAFSLEQVGGLGGNGFDNLLALLPQPLCLNVLSPAVAQSDAYLFRVLKLKSASCR